MLKLMINGAIDGDVICEECEFNGRNETITIDGEERDLTPSPGAEYYGNDEFGGGLYSEVREDDDGNEFTIIFKMWEDAGDEDGEHPEPEDCCDWENPVEIIMDIAEDNEFKEKYGISDNLFEEIREDLIGGTMTACEMDNYMMEADNYGSCFDEIEACFENGSASFRLNDIYWINVVFTSNYEDFEPGILDEDGDEIEYDFLHGMVTITDVEII